MRYFKKEGSVELELEIGADSNLFKGIVAVHGGKIIHSDIDLTDEDLKKFAAMGITPRTPEEEEIDNQRWKLKQKFMMSDNLYVDQWPKKEEI